MKRVLGAAAGLVMAGLVLAGCASTPAPSDPESFDRQAVLEMTRELSRDSLFGRAPDTDGSRRAQELITARMREIGLETVGGGYLWPFEYGDFIDRETGETGPLDNKGTNIIGYLPGRSKGVETLVVTAHYDHVGVRDGQIYNGADDNASGVATMLAVAEYFAANRPRHNMLFVAFDGEEGGFHGARAFVKSPPVPPTWLAANLNFDMISRGEDGGLWASGAHHWPVLAPLIEDIAVEAPIQFRMGFDNGSGRDDDWTAASDHYAFFRAGIPHLYLGVEDHEDYHQPTDDFANIQPEVFLAAVETALMVAIAMDEELEEIAEMRQGEE